MDKQTLLDSLAPHQQTHLLDWWDQLTLAQQVRLASEIQSIDFQRVARLIAFRSHVAVAGTADRALRAQAPTELVRLHPNQNSAAINAARDAGEGLLREGKVAAVLVAGGQGSRLGFDAPKGVFPIGPVSQRSLFQVLCEQLLARSRRAQCNIPYLIMTSAATHNETVAYFEQHAYFGLPAHDVFFFQQASLPALDANSHRILLADKSSINLSPDGHGGILSALKSSGLLQNMADRGIEHFYYHQVDNPTAIVCDPVFLGLHVQHQSEMSTKVVAKVHPHEKMGVAVTIDGQTQIIEYSDLTPEVAERRDAAGQHIFWAGNTAIHAFRLDFLLSLTAGNSELPFHIAHKPLSYLDESGKVVPAHPQQPNAHKFEQFIFDALPQAKVALVVEAERAREFNPVKNATGADSPETSRAALIRLACEWVCAAGHSVKDGVPIEISPLFALDADDCKRRLPPRQNFDRPTILSDPDLNI